VNSKRFYREYLKSKGLDCQEFIKLEDDWYTMQIITYKDSKGNTKTENICVKAMLRWMFKSFGNKVWEGYKGE